MITEGTKESMKKSISVGKKVLVVTGMMLALFMAAPAINSQAVDNMLGVETSYASELPYSTRWETQADGNWKYKLDNGSYANTAWVRDEVDGNWYLLNESGVMRSGIFESYGKYYLLSEVHDGHFGHLVKNGEVYNGITISASTNVEDEGALSPGTINALKGLGYNFSSSPSVTGTQHVSNGQVTSGVSNTSQSSSSQSQNSSSQISSDRLADAWRRMNNCNNCDGVDDVTGWKAGDSTGLPNLH